MQKTDTAKRLRDDVDSAERETVHGDLQLLIYGDLYPEPEHILRLAQRRWKVVHLGATCSHEVVVHKIETSQAIFFNNVDINPFLKSLGTTRIAVLAATGYSFVDVSRAQLLGVRIARLVNYSSPAVVDYMIASVLGLLRPIGIAAERVRNGDWDKSGLFGRELAHQRAGVIGCGKIGGQLIERLLALGLAVSYTTRSSTTRKLSYDTLGVGWQDIDSIMEKSDIVFVCCDSNETSAGLLDFDRLQKLKHGALLISISPNAVIDLEALSGLLKSREDLRAVLDLDPLPKSHGLLECANVTITPHIAFASSETVRRRMDECIDTLFAGIDGKDVAWISPRLSGAA